MKVKDISSRLKLFAGVVFLKSLRRGLPLTGIILTAMSGVFMFNSGSAQSPVLASDDIQISTKRTSANDQAASKPAADTAAKKSNPPSAQAGAPAPSAAATSGPASVAVQQQVQASGQPWNVKELYVDPSTDAGRQAQQWAATRPADAAVMARMAATPQAVWFGGWNANLQAAVSSYVGAAAANAKMPVLVAYNIPSRDCGSYSAGGAAAATDYTAWMQKLVAGIAGRPAVVILEPDALSQLHCLSAADQNTRLTLMKQAVASLKSSRATYVYIDAGNSGWHPAATMAPRLQQAGIAGADGFSLNVSNFYATAQSVSYGNQLSGLVGGKHYVVDTSRNGKGALSGEAWCNPPGRALGANPTTVQSSGPLVDALLWIKTPGQSDGTCNGGPPAGSWWADYALGLARTAGW